MIQITNKKVDKSDSNTFYCGRPSVLGNPFEMESELDRNIVIDEYKKWLEDKLNVGDITISNRISTMIVHYKSHGELKLMCWCYPKRCHCEVIKEILEKLI